MRTEAHEVIDTVPLQRHSVSAWYDQIAPAELLPSLLFFLAIAFQVFVAWKFRALTWDDSAITLGFSRTFAMTGKIEPTPGSGIVEGYSTTLWMLLMTAVAKVLSNPHALLAAAKVASLALNLASLFLMREWFDTWMPRALGTLIAGICGCSFMHYETINGMETPLLLALILSMLLLRRWHHRSARWMYLAAGAGVVMTRWEAIWLLIPFVLMERPSRRAILSASVWVSTFVALSIGRRLYFGDFLPNTITAKHGVPYVTGTPHEQLGQHLLQLSLIAGYPAYFAVVVLLFLLAQGLVSPPHTTRRKPWEFYFTMLFVIFSVALTVGIGYNWGPPLRSFYTGWPFLFALLLFPLAKGWSAPRLRWFSLVAVGVMALFTLVHVRRSLRELRLSYAPAYMPDATVAKIGTVSDALSAIQQATGKHDLLFAGPDMGAVMLFSSGIRVIDLGLLCNRTLAHERYGAMERYVLEQQKPDVIEVHGLWTPLTGLETSERFHQDYRPVMVNGKRMFLRNSLIASIPQANLQRLTFVPGVEDPKKPEEPGFRSEDVALSRSFGSYLLLKQ